MKTQILIKAIVLLSLVSSSAFAVADKGFYNEVKSLSGYKLKTALKNIVKRTHVNKGYGALMTVYFSSDVDTNYDGDGSIVDMYSENPSSYDAYKFSKKAQKCGNYKKESDCFNREHLFPQGTFNKGAPMRSDFFHVYPSDGYVNGRRSNFPFGEVNDPMWVSANGSKLGKNTFGGYGGKVFEPIDEFKGDIARALLYFATRYEDRVTNWNHAMLNGTNDQVYADWFIKLLVKWHKMDPISKHEMRRNDIGEKYQGNRNPFIDNPQWVEEIWGHVK